MNGDCSIISSLGTMMRSARRSVLRMNPRSSGSTRCCEAIAACTSECQCTIRPHRRGNHRLTDTSTSGNGACETTRSAFLASCQRRSGYAGAIGSDKSVPSDSVRCTGTPSTVTTRGLPGSRVARMRERHWPAVPRTTCRIAVGIPPRTSGM
jgi:hypothetical protein